MIGVDSSEAMLPRARSKLPGVDFRLGELTALPLEDGHVVGAVCALPLSHLQEIGPAISELVRVLRPGGRLVVSNSHPFATAILGWRAMLVDTSDRCLRGCAAGRPCSVVWEVERQEAISAGCGR